MRSEVSKNLSKSGMERNPNNRRGNTIDRKGSGKSQELVDKKALLLERFAKVAGKK